MKTVEAGWNAAVLSTQYDDKEEYSLLFKVVLATAEASGTLHDASAVLLVRICCSRIHRFLYLSFERVCSLSFIESINGSIGLPSISSKFCATTLPSVISSSDDAGVVAYQ